jgi:hypothetical protein
MKRTTLPVVPGVLGSIAISGLLACGSSSKSDVSEDSGADSPSIRVDSSADSPPHGVDSGHDATARDAAAKDSAPLEYDQVAPTPAASWVAVTNNLTGLTSECGNMGGVYPDPTQDRLISGVALEGLWASTDGAATWVSIGKSGDSIKNRLSSIVWDPATPTTFWESGIYGWETGTDGAFITTDDGASFTGYAGLSTAQMGGNTNDSISIDFSDPMRKTLLAGSHETKQVLYLSTDTGKTWTNIGASYPTGLGFCTTTLIIDSSTFLVGCAASWSGEAGAVLRSTDGGKSWTNVHPSGGVVDPPLWASDGTLYWAAEGGGILKSADQGQTWTQAAATNTAGTVRPLELPDGRIVSVENEAIVITADQGATWTTIGTPMPYVPVGLAYSPFRAAFYIWYFTCTGTNAVPADAIMQFGWDYR